MKLPIGKAFSYSYSNICGHGAFILLAASYLETDFFQLRLYAARFVIFTHSGTLCASNPNTPCSGVTLSILFQYYRAIPLKIPIKWNSLFLLINVYMMALLLKEARDAQHMPAEQKQLYSSVSQQREKKKVNWYYKHCNPHFFSFFSP